MLPRRESPQLNIYFFLSCNINTVTIFTSLLNNKLLEIGKLIHNTNLWFTTLSVSNNQTLWSSAIGCMILFTGHFKLWDYHPPYPAVPHMSYFWDQVFHMDITYLSCIYRPKCKLFMIWKVRQILCHCL